jgi:hypothetical protein
MKKTTKMIAICMSLILMHSNVYSKSKEDKKEVNQTVEVNSNNQFAIRAIDEKFTTVEICHLPSLKAFENWTNEQMIQKMSGINGVTNVQITSSRNFILKIENSLVDTILLKYFNITLK